MKISVITVCYNGAPHLEQAISSVLSQSYHDLEYVIVDGASSDGTVEIIEAHAARDSRIRWVSEPDLGISDAMNKGVRMASGEIIAHLHSDDFYPDSEVISGVAASFSQNRDAVWLTGGLRLVGRTGQFLRDIKVRRYSYRRLIHSNIILHPATFIRRGAFLALGGFDPGLRYCMDYHLWLRLAEQGDPARISRTLACFRVHDGSRSTAQASSAYAEELQVRLDFLQRHGNWQFPCKLEYLVKKQLNRFSVKRLVACASRQDQKASS